MIENKKIINKVVETEIDLNMMSSPSSKRNKSEKKSNK